METIKQNTNLKRGEREGSEREGKIQGGGASGKGVWVQITHIPTLVGLQTSPSRHLLCLQHMSLTHTPSV